MEDPARYGRSFAEVYDRWYPGGDEASVTGFLRSRLPPGGRVLELGVGTGRLGLPLAAAGFAVVGLDSSEEMLGRLAAKDPAGAVERVAGDAGRGDHWPPGPFDAVLAACNLLVNLETATAQRDCVRAAADALGPGGLFVVELSRLHPRPGPDRRLELRSVTAEAVVLVASETDPATGVVDGAHVELRDGQPVRLRPWRIRVLSLAQLDTWCEEADLALVERVADWSGTPDDGSSATTVSTYRAAGA